MSQVCCCCRWNLTFPFIGLILSFTECLLAALVNFHPMGFFVGILGLVCSAVFLYLIMKSRGEQKPTTTHVKIQRDLLDTEDDDVDNGNNEVVEYEALPKIKRETCFPKFIWFCFVTIISIIGFLAFIRLFSLFRRIQWRKELGANFPSNCGSWAEADGCTRITLDKSGCVRQFDIPTENSILFSETLLKDWDTV